MAQQKAPIEINKFVGGLFTDANPLTFPENTSAVDVNMELNSDGSRQRALGIDYETGYEEVTTTISSASSIQVGFNTYRWENVSGDPDKVIICVQFGNEVKFFDADATPLSSGLLHTELFSASPTNIDYSFADVDGNIVIASGINLIYTGVFDGTNLTFTSATIKVRDFFGVEDYNGATDLTVGTGLQFRPTTMSQTHLYNLRNQGFGIPRVQGNDEIITDPINTFYGVHNTVKGVYRYPSNSDTVAPYLFADPNDTDDRNSKRYFAFDSVKNPLGTTRAAQGYFIIDLLNRGASRLAEDIKNRSTFSELAIAVSALPQDYTSGGATAVGEFAGRVWYGGFSGDVIDGDEKSPKLSSYIAFSKLITNPSETTICYQEADPTSPEDPDLVDTDGGYIRLNNAYGIKDFKNLGSSLMVLASNGIWRVYGGNDSGFSATNYLVEKVTDKGVRGKKSIVQVENTVVYWSDDGIYHLKQNEFGDWQAENYTQNRIQKFYDAISTEDKEACVGVYDAFQRKIRWTYGNRLTVNTQQKELVFNINLNAFYERHISKNNKLPIMVGGFNTNTYKVSEVADVITVLGEPVTVLGSDVTVTVATRSSITSLFEVGYVIVTELDPVIKYTFGAQTNTNFVDWFSVDNVGIDSPATLVTGAASGGDNMRFKQVPYLYVHMIRTEDGFEGDFVPTNQSSCIVQSQWDWTNSANSNKWGIPFQAYRYKRLYMPADINDDFETGHETIVSKNKLRGRGRALSVKFTSEPGKEMHLLGWSLIMGMNGNV